MPTLVLERFLNSQVGEHLFTPNQFEIDYIEKELPAFQFEAKAFTVIDI